MAAKRVFAYALLLLLVQTAVFADVEVMPCWDKFERVYPKLKLSKKQRIKAQAIHIDGLTQSEAIQAEIEAKQWQIDRLKLADLEPETQAAQIDIIQSEIDRLHEKNYEVYQKSISDFESILRKKQLERYQETD